jgi:hypothetical protein
VTAAPLVEAGALARSRAFLCGAPDPGMVVRCVIGDDQGRTIFHYDDGRDPWVLRGIEEVGR